MLVKKIREGVVVDHIPPGRGLEILSLIKDHVEGRAVLLVNAPSKKMGRKDILKIENGLSKEMDLHIIALFAPNATLNTIKDWKVVKKEKIKLPGSVKGLLRCPNPKCITNDERERRFLNSSFSLKGKEYVCDYCGACIDAGEVSRYLTTDFYMQ